MRSISSLQRTAKARQEPSLSQAKAEGSIFRAPHLWDLFEQPAIRVLRQPTRAAQMRILVLTKRQYMGKDLLDDRFGRFWELPLELARRGHEIRGISLSYRKKSEGSSTPSLDAGTGNITWHSVNLLNAPWLGPRRYFRLVRQIMGDCYEEIRLRRSAHGPSHCQ